MVKGKDLEDIDRNGEINPDLKLIFIFSQI